MKKLLAATLMTALLAGCATGPRVDTTYTAKSQSSRVKFVIIHYTVSDLPSSIRILTNEVVSSHYLLTDEAKPTLYRLVDESRVSNHAGVSSWKAYSLLNPSSIGIEIVNPGMTVNYDGSRTWYAFSQAQMDILIPLLKDIVKRHNIAPENILGHADIAPQRKQDPGALFPWKQLADAGLIPWPDADKVAALLPGFEQQLPDIAWFQQKLAAYGYAVPQHGQFDEATRNVISTFQMKYRPTDIQGNPDAQTAALLEVMAPAGPLAAPAPLVPVGPQAYAVPAAQLPPAVTPAAPAAAPAAPSAPALPAVPAVPPAPPAPGAVPPPTVPAVQKEQGGSQSVQPPVQKS